MIFPRQFEQGLALGQRSSVLGFVFSTQVSAPGYMSALLDPRDGPLDIRVQQRKIS